MPDLPDGAVVAKAPRATKPPVRQRSDQFGDAGTDRSSPGGRSSSRSPKVFEQLAPVALVPYLEAFGYHATDQKTWQGAKSPTASASPPSEWPVLTIEVPGHIEQEGHTWYQVDCNFQMPDAEKLTWRSQKRLGQLREELHDALKSQLGAEYAGVFAKTPFALKGGLPGTTSRLHCWMGALASFINSGKATPALVGLVLQYVEAPMPDRNDGFSMTICGAQGVDQASGSDGDDGGEIKISLLQDEDELLHPHGSEGDLAAHQEEEVDWFADSGPKVAEVIGRE